MKTPLLETERLRLEPVSLEHAASLQRHFADYEVIKYLTTSVPWPYPDDGVESFLRDVLLPNVASGKAMAWALVLKEEGEAVGLLEWRRDPAAEDSRGFWLARPHWGRGLMTEAVSGFQDWVFTEGGETRLEVRNAVQNVGSRRIKEKTGGVYLGRVRCEQHEGDEAELWELTAERWKALRGL